MNGLALRKHIRVLLVARLSGSEPLEGRAAFSGLNLDTEYDLVRGVTFVLVLQVDGQWRAIWLQPGGSQIEIGLFATNLDIDNVQETWMSVRVIHLIVNILEILTSYQEQFSSHPWPASPASGAQHP